MKIINYDEPVPHIIVNNLYTQNELSMIWEELNFLCYPMKMDIPSRRESAYDIETGEILKSNTILNIDGIYTDRKYSNILNINRKVLNPKFYKHNHWMFSNFIPLCDTTLISYYENENYYKKHHDASAITVLTWFYKEPKKFNGGDLILSSGENDKVIEVKNNRCVIFPGAVHHTVTTVSMDKKYDGTLSGRICMSQFLHYHKLEQSLTTTN